ncbi:MAG TPA: S46 family peptidase, partial [Saprospiraceae bacterium]|nr:S46 family peptidase [Saprospiraceae bacterium]
SSIGKFGADTDNWMWPRHSGDFSMFRIYADKDNHPATYSESNVPYTPKHFLPISLDGVETGDFTLVFGFPGRTQEYLPSVAIEQIIKKLNPDKIAIREASLAVMDKYMRQDPQIKIQYASKFAGIANYWKKWIGESQGLVASNAVATKKQLEADFKRIVAEKGLTVYQGIFDDFDKLYSEYGEVAQARDYWIEVIYRNIELMNLSFQLYRLEQVYDQKGAETFIVAKDDFIAGLDGFYKNYNAQVDRDIFAKLMRIYYEKYPDPTAKYPDLAQAMRDKAQYIYTNSKLVSYPGIQSIFSGDEASVILDKLHADPAYVIGKKFSEQFFNEINPNYYKIKDQLEVLQKKYIKGLITVFPDSKYFPDANSTLRVTYGQVKGYEPKDGVEYLPVSYLDDVIEKYIPGDYEFDVSKKLQDLYASKDFGSYGEHSKMPVNFIGTNHTTGGNSGSPVLDANGYLIWLNFDRVWEGTMSDYNYDATICRNIMVDARYILFIIDKYAGAKHLIDEMQLV